MRLWLVVIASLGVAACGNLDAIDYVRDLRILAMRADPPDQLLDPNALRAGVQAGTSSTAPVQITALVAWPNNGNAQIDYQFSTCALLDPNAFSCIPTSPAYQVFDSGTTTASSGTVQISTTLSPNDVQIALALQQDSYHGFGGLRLPVNITLQTSSDRVVGTKLVVYTLPTAGSAYVPNQNPNISGATVESTPWPNPGAFTFSTAAQPKDGWDITPLFDPNEQVAYQVPTFAGGTLPLSESWLFDYFSTFGDYFSPVTTGGTAIATNVKNPPDSHFTPPAQSATTPGTVYVVVRDGRGGENWLVLDAELTP